MTNTAFFQSVFKCSVIFSKWAILGFFVPKLHFHFKIDFFLSTEKEVDKTHTCAHNLSPMKTCVCILITWDQVKRQILQAICSLDNLFLKMVWVQTLQLSTIIWYFKHKHVFFQGKEQLNSVCSWVATCSMYLRKYDKRVTVSLLLQLDVWQGRYQEKP